MSAATARDVRLYHRLQLAAHALSRLSDRQLREAVGLTTAQVAVMSAISAGRRVNQRDVAAELGVNESAVTGMVTRLTRLGLVERSQDDRDRRAWILRLTPEGRSSLRRASGAFRHVNDALERALSPDEIGVAVSILDRVTRSASSETP